MGSVGCGEAGLGWVGLGWVGLGWVELGGLGLRCARLGRWMVAVAAVLIMGGQGVGFSV